VVIAKTSSDQVNLLAASMGPRSENRGYTQNASDWHNCQALVGFILCS
jgi:hypothetical protein